MEITFVAIKPDGVQRGLVHEVIRRLEVRGFKLVGMKMVQATISQLEEHYAEHKGKPFLPGLLKYMSSGPIVTMAWEGKDVVAQVRKILGATRPLQADVGTLRGDFCIDCGKNLVHGSDSVESGKREVSLWFKPEELCKWTSCQEAWLFE